VSDDLTNFVEDSPNTRMYCVRAEHKPFPCSVGIPPLPSIISTD
jgi:hypothetical protein